MKSIINKIYKYNVWFWVLLLMVITFAVYSGVTVAANLNWFGRENHRGYFTNYKDNSGENLFDGGLKVNNKDDFVDKIRHKLYSSKLQDQRGAAFIILTMMNIDAGRNGANINGAKDVYDKWEAKINYYNSAGAIDFKEMKPYRYNTYWQSSPGNDVAGFSKIDSAESIVFKDPNNLSKDVYIIKRVCGNPVGKPKNVPNPNWNLNATSLVGFIGRSINKQSINVRVGDKITFKHTVTNAGSYSMRKNLLSSIRWTKPGSDVIYSYTTPGGLEVNEKYSKSVELIIPKASSGTKYCQNITAKPDTISGGEVISGSACAIVVGTTQLPGAEVITIVPDYEKGSGDFIIEHIVKIDKPTTGCPGSIKMGILRGDALQYFNVSDPSLVEDDTKCEYLKKTEIKGASLDGKDPGYVYSQKTKYEDIEAKDTGTVYEVPYARFYGQDTFATGCGDDDSSNLINGKIFFNTKDLTTSAGGASQYAAIAESTVNMATAAFRSSDPKLRNGLSVANYTGPADCSETIYNNVIGAIKDQSTIYDTVQTIPNLTTFNATIPTGGQTIATKDGKDIYISGNITGGAIDQIATIVSEKNIYIAPGVTRIDAVLIAKGTVYTCATSDTLPLRTNWQNLPTDSTAGCRNTLTINGAVSAKNIRFARSIGTRLLSEANEHSANAGKDNIGERVPGGNSTTAEVINYPAYLNFSSLNLQDQSVNSAQAIFNLPPLL